ncbi:MAG: hypothetical protein QM758_16300 [Armatimonas sp.]
MRPRVELVNFSATQAGYALSYSSVIRCLALATLLLLGAGCGGRKKPIKVAPSPSPSTSPIPVGVSADGATWMIQKNGERLLKVTADSAEAAPDTSGKLEAQFHGQKATLYRNNAPFMELTGDVSADDLAQTVTVKNALATFLKDNLRVSSDTITWNRATARLNGNGNVRALLGTAELQGKKFTADERLSRIEIDQ